MKINYLAEYLPKISGLSGLVGGLCGAVSSAFGGWDRGIQALLAVMAVDYLTGLIVAGVFHNSKKSPNGALESKAGWKGLFRKGATLLMLLVAAQLDQVIGSHFIRDGVVAAYIVNELVSVLENVGLMGVPVPAAMRRAIDILKQKSEEEK